MYLLNEHLLNIKSEYLFEFKNQCLNNVYCIFALDLNVIDLIHSESVFLLS